jgi:argininosuccinate lyase
MRELAGALYSTATDLADYLVRKGLPFREAHEMVGRTVRYALAHGKELSELTLEEFRGIAPLVDGAVYEAITVDASLRARAVVGGTAPEAVRRQIDEARKLVARDGGA